MIWISKDEKQNFEISEDAATLVFTFHQQDLTAIPPAAPRHVALLSNTVIEQDPRVRKSAAALHAAGWHVTTIGLRPPTNDTSTLPWHTIHLDRPLSPIDTTTLPPPSQGLGYLFQRAVARLQQRGTVLSRLRYYYDLRVGLRLTPHTYQHAFHQSAPALQHFEEAGQTLTDPVDVWVANDWEMLPIGHALRAKKGGVLVYDSHEFATDQFSHNKTWRTWKRPLVQAVEQTLISQADAVSSVSPGVCIALQKKYNLAETPACIRNIPAYTASPFRPTTTPLHCLYHGLVGPGRSLEELILSTNEWRGDFRLTIRGPEGTAGYVKKLKALAIRHQSKVPIAIEPPVPLARLISEARKADIGIMALATKSAHNQYALPNKVFEYMMAGLGLCVTPNQDMAALVKRYGNGLVLESRSPAHIAAGINSLTPDRVNRFKQASLAAAKELHWENEQITMLHLLDTVCPPAV